MNAHAPVTGVNDPPYRSKTISTSDPLMNMTDGKGLDGRCIFVGYKKMATNKKPIKCSQCGKPSMCSKTCALVVAAYNNGKADTLARLAAVAAAAGK